MDVPGRRTTAAPETKAAIKQTILLNDREFYSGPYKYIPPTPFMSVEEFKRETEERYRDEFNRMIKHAQHQATYPNAYSSELRFNYGVVTPDSPAWLYFSEDAQKILKECGIGVVEDERGVMCWSKNATAE